METLDLHGVRHHQVDEVTRSFLNFIELPCQIVTGNSPRMKEIVKKESYIMEHGDIMLFDGYSQMTSTHAVPEVMGPLGDRINMTFRSGL